MKRICTGLQRRPAGAWNRQSLSTTDKRLPVSRSIRLRRVCSTIRHLQRFAVVPGRLRQLRAADVSEA